MMEIADWESNKDPGYKNKESTKNRLQRARYPRQSTVWLIQLHLGREVVHRPLLKTRGMRTIITHTKGRSEGTRSMAYNRAKKMSENE
jgi:hypothetical protein